MLRSAWWVVRQRRYLRLAILMLFVAAGCVVAGTWQISRYEQTGRDNRAMDGNAHAPAAPFAAVGVPLVGHGVPPGRDAIRYRTVTATGTYIARSQQFLGNQSVGGRDGFYVTDPLRVDGGVVIVVRGFVAAKPDGNVPSTVAAAPSGVQHVVGRLQTTSSHSDAASELGDGEIESINPADQAARVHAPVFDAYLTLRGRQAGTAGLTLVPEPDLSNPAGGAVEPQHLAYIVQWYLFALLALAAPFAIARYEVRAARREFLGFDADADEFGPDPVPTQVSLAGGSAEELSGADVALRERGTLARQVAAAQTWDRAERLASRYGRSLNAGGNWRPNLASYAANGVGLPDGETGDPVTNSAERPHRSPDAYHASYNDYLWQLALADGETPPGPAPRRDAVSRFELPELEATVVRQDGPTVVTSLPASGDAVASTPRDDADDA